ncbi:hypothetical protein CFOL_v3_13472 [Cephalotus follicularis]|uniref:WPP domain-associated protein n=1 Tax=Cephalotus follicularis TaxID=3775 RepID=A0A1Q3BQJ9_CEPFO|nr:hypothetical protein CFOL_v3_13472 [Cephalotus follicularis]
MDEIFGEMDGRLRASVTDSTMMCIVHYAMDKAHEKVKSKEGVIERLNEISKFYELAVMQLEGCLKLVQEETDGYILESSHGDLLADLKEIRDRLQGRLKESELAISEKDRELMERLENDLKLRQALELQERELVSLRANLELEKMKTEGVEDFVLSNHVSTDEDRDGEFFELKNTVDQQVLNIKLKLEPDYKSVDEGKLQSVDNIKIDQMGSDIDVLKQTLDLAFVKMQNAIFLSELGPIEQQWRWTIERDAIAITIKGFMKDFQENFKAEMRKQEKKISDGLSEQFSDLIIEITCLRNQLESLCNLNDFQVKNTKDSESLASVPETDVRKRGKSLSEGDSNGNSNSSFNVRDDEAEDDGHYVAKMIKNHESIIRRKSEEMNFLQREFLHAKVCSSFRREKEPVSLKTRIQEVITRLDNIINWNANMGEVFSDHRGIYEEDSSGPKGHKFDLRDREISSIEGLQDVWKRVNENPVSSAANKDLQNEIRMLKQEKDDAELQNMITEDIYFTVFKGLIDEFYDQFRTSDLESLKREGMHEGALKDMFDDSDENIESNKTETKTGEEMHQPVFSEVMNDFALADSLDCGSDCNKDLTSSTKLLGSLEGALRDNVCTIFFQEMYKEWSESIERYNDDNVVKEEISWIVLHEAIKDILNSANDTLGKLQEVRFSDNLMCGLRFDNEAFEENSLKMDVILAFFREVVKEWTMKIDAYHFESLIREEIHRFVIIQAVKEACTMSGEAEAQTQHEISEDKLHTNRQSSGVENLFQTIETLLKCFKAEEDLILTASSEIKEHNAHLDLVGLELEEFDENKIFQELLTGEKNTSNSVNSKLEKALQQLVMSEAVLSEFVSSLGIAVGNPQRVPQRMMHITDIIDEKQSFTWQEINNEELKSCPSDSVLNPILEFSQVLVNFEHTAHPELQMNIFRLEKMKSDLDPLVELVASLRAKESLYQKAFIRRCQNLRKAENEVDLLGDQVNVLLSLLEKIYMKLYHHSSGLQKYFEVSKILKLIKKELTGEVDAS